MKLKINNSRDTWLTPNDLRGQAVYGPQFITKKGQLAILIPSNEAHDQPRSLMIVYDYGSTETKSLDEWETSSDLLCRRMTADDRVVIEGG